MFAGAAFYINFSEHPARLGLDDKSALAEWKPSYSKGYDMQASLAMISGLLGLLVGWKTSDWRWAVGAVLILANWPYTLLIMAPTNKKLYAIAPADASPQASRELLETWARLHAARDCRLLGRTTLIVSMAADRCSGEALRRVLPG
jgi:hypothetical protein